VEGSKASIQPAHLVILLMTINAAVDVDTTVATQLVQVDSILPHSGVTTQRALDSIVYITLDVDLCVFECDLQ